MASSKNALNAITTSVKYKSYNQSCTSFKSAFNNFITRLSKKLDDLSITTKSFSNSSGKLTLENNTVFKYTGTTGVSNLTIEFPDTSFISTIILYTAKSGNIQITFPKDAVFVGRRKLEFFPQEQWEISIHDKRVVAVQIFENK